MISKRFECWSTAALVMLACGGAWGESADVLAGTLVVLTYDDSALPSQRGESVVTVLRSGGVSEKIAVKDGWPVGIERAVLEQAFAGMPEPDAGMGVARVLIAGKGSVDVVIQTRRAERLGLSIGQAPLDELKTTARKVPLSTETGRSTKVFCGKLVQELALSIVKIAPALFPPEGHVATPFYSMHHQQFDQVISLVPYQGGTATFSSIFPEADGGWRFYVIGPGSFYVGAYALGYGEVKSTGFVVRSTDNDRTQVFDIAPHLMEPMAWAILVIEVAADVSVDRCLGVELAYNAKIFSRDPGKPRERLEELRPRVVYLIQPTHKRWLVGMDEISQPRHVPFGMMGNSWTVAAAKMSEEIAAQSQRVTARGATLKPGACVDDGVAVREAHVHETELKQVVRTTPELPAVYAFMGTAKALSELPIFIDGEVAIKGLVAPAGDLSKWTLDHASLRQSREILKKNVTAPEFQLKPYAITTLRIKAAIGVDGKVESEIVRSDPEKIPPLEQFLAPPEARVTRSLVLPPSLEPSIESVHLHFATPFEVLSLVVEIGPAGQSPDGGYNVLMSDSQTAVISYEFLPLPEGVERVVSIRAGVIALDRTIGPLQERCDFVIQGDEIKRAEAE